MENALGTIITIEGSPSTTEFSFVINKDADVKKGQYIEVRHDSKRIFGYIAEIIRANRYFERAESVAEYEKTARIEDHFPSKNWEYTIAQVRILGTFCDNRFLRTFSPPYPGDLVYTADSMVLKDFLGFTEDGLHIGAIQHHDVPVKLCMTRLFQKHLAILAMSGSGKCITHDTPIMLADGTKKKIGELAITAFSNGEIHKEGGTEIAVPKKSISVLSLNNNYKLTSNRVYAITRRRSPKKLIKLKTRTGREIILTHEHPLLVAGDGPEWKKVSEIKEGDYIAVPRELSFGNLIKINLLEFYKDSELMRILDKKTMAELKKELCARRIKISRCIAYQISEGCMPIRTFYKLCSMVDRADLFYKAEKIRHFSSRSAIPAELKFDRKLGRFVGYLMGDGHVSNNCLDLSASNPEIREDFKRLSFVLFGFSASSYPTSVRVHSKTLVCVMNDVFGVKPSAESKMIPDTILSANQEFVSGFITGLFDTDGSVSLKKPEIEFCSKSKCLVDGAILMLLKFGIPSVRKIKYNKRYDCIYHRLYVGGSSNLKIFLNRISFVSDKKRSRLENMASLTSNTNIDVIPCIEPLLSDVMKKLRISESETARRAGVANNMHRYYCDVDAPSRETFGKIVMTLSRRADELRYLCTSVQSITIPSINLNSILVACGEIRASNKMRYKQIAERCSVSAPTIRRMLCGETAITDSLLEIGKGISEAALHNGTERLDNLLYEHQQIVVLDASKLFRLADSIGLSYELLDQYSGLWNGAWASYKRGDRRASLDAKAHMTYGLKLAVSEIIKDINSCSGTLDLLNSLSDSSIFWDNTVQLTKINSNDNYVYDIVLKKNHNFLAGETPLVVHNSHLSSVILEELLERKKESGRIAIVVIDIHGEYVGFRHDDVFGSVSKVIEGKDIAVPFRKISPDIIEEWLPNISAPQKEVLRHGMNVLREKKNSGGYTIKDLFEAIDSADISRDEAKRALKRSVAELGRYHFLSKNKENPKFISDLKPGELLIFDFSSIDSLRKKQILVSLVARRLFKLRKKNKIPPFLLLIEEAHNFARENAEARDAVSRSVIETIAREGRKFGASLCLISQRPVNLSTTALSQCNTHIILRVTNPNDLEHIQMSSEGIDSRVAKSITGLKVGEAIIVGEAVNYPVFVEVRNRKSKKREKGAPLHKQAIDFELETEKKDKQVEAFL